MVGDGVVHVAVGRGPFVRPVVVAVPVGLAEIEARPEARAAEGIDHATCEVSLCRTFFAGAAIIGIFTIKHAEAVVVFGGEDDVFHAGTLGGFCPALGIELFGIECFVERPVGSLVVLVVGAASVDPRLIADIPALHDAPLGVDAPVHHEAELQVLPFGDALQNGGVALGDRVVLGFHTAH